MHCLVTVLLEKKFHGPFISRRPVVNRALDHDGSGAEQVVVHKGGSVRHSYSQALRPVFIPAYAVQVTMYALSTKPGARQFPALGSSKRPALFINESHQAVYG